METNTVHNGFEIDLADAERWGAGVAAAVLFGYGASRRTVSGYLLAVASAPLAYRAIAGAWPPGLSQFVAADDSRAVLAGNRGLNVRESIRIEQPVDDVYRFWRHFENLPLFMRHVKSVTDLGDGRSRWVVDGPAGLRVSWDAEIINEVENETIGWRSLPGSDVVTAGSVNFKPVRTGRGTQISVNLQYAPPAGRAGSYAAMLMGREPSQTIREDLRRLKQLIEAGEVAQAVPPERQGVY